MSIAEMYNYYMYEIADPRFLQWPLAGTPVPILCITIIYLSFVKIIGPAIMHDRKPFDLKKILQAYNVFQIFSCCYIMHGFTKYGWLRNYMGFGCYVLDYSDNDEVIGVASIIWWTLLLKISELIETVFFVLRKKDNQVSKLHLYHHISTMQIVWIGVHYIPGGVTVFPIFLNCFIHVIMYTYYLGSTFGPKWQKILKPWKPRITMLQMIQFCFILIFIGNLLKPSCTVHRACSYVLAPNILVVFYMFYNFYKISYTKKKLNK